VTGFAYDFSGERWARTKSRFVDLCVNRHGDALLERIRRLDAGDCVHALSPLLADWLDGRVLPAVRDRIASTERSQEREDWSVGLALFTFSPARRTGQAKGERDTDRMTADLCRSLPKLRQCFMRESDECARGVLGRCLGSHFSDTKDRLVLVELKELNLRIWWRIERVLREILTEWEEAARSDDPRARRTAREKLASEAAQAREVVQRLPRKLGITRWERVQLYLEVFGTPASVDIADVFWIGDDSAAEQELLMALNDCLDADDAATALTPMERESILREYIHGIPKGISSSEFTAAYGVSRPVHNKQVQSGLVKLGQCLGYRFGEGE
jgi:hypothetical protein